MRRALYIVLLMALATCMASISAHAQGNVGIGTTSPDASALLDLTSNSKGLLVPRMTESQKNAIATPATGLLIYETDTATTGSYAGQAPTFWYYSGTTWIPFLGAAWQLLGNSGTNPSGNFIGTKDSVDWVIRTRDTERVRIYAGGNMALPNFTNTAEEIRWFMPSGSGSYYTGFKCDTMIRAVTYILPPSDGQATNWVMCTDGFGDLSWRGFGSAGGGGIDTMWSRGTGTLALVGHGVGNISSGNYSISSGYDNTASGTATVCWGEYNIASGYAAVVGGGTYDTASGNYSTVGGGSNNSASGAYSSVVAGQYNEACGMYAVVVGGSYNKACGSYATILGGSNNTVSGSYSLAYGIGCNVTTDNTIVYYSSNGTPMKVGIGLSAPTEALHVYGNIRFTGALMPNGNAGTTGYVLASTGSNSAPVWTSSSNLFWSTSGNTGTSSSTNYLGTSDAKDLVFKTNNTERMRVLSTGQVGINTSTPGHQLHVVSSSTTDEVAAVCGQTTAATSNQAIGAWGMASATGTNTGTIGVLATGNGNTSAGTTNVALQINDGEFAMGRTTEAPGLGTVVEGATGGTAYSAQGPSGVIELTLGGGNLSTSAPTSGVYQDLGTLTINNRYTSASSIVLVSVLQKSDDGVAPDCKLAQYFVDVDNRTTGAFDIRIGMIPTTTNASNYSTSDKIRIGYTIINPGR